MTFRQMIKFPAMSVQMKVQSVNNHTWSQFFNISVWVLFMSHQPLCVMLRLCLRTRAFLKNLHWRSILTWLSESCSSGIWHGKGKTQSRCLILCTACPSTIVFVLDVLYYNHLKVNLLFLFIYVKMSVYCIQPFLHYIICVFKESEHSLTSSRVCLYCTYQILWMSPIYLYITFYLKL